MKENIVLLALQLLLVVLKVCNVIAWSWAVVFLPVIIVYFIMLPLFLLILGGVALLS